MMSQQWYFGYVCMKCVMREMYVQVRCVYVVCMVCVRRVVC